MTSVASPVRIAASIRLAYLMLRLAASIEDNFGRTVLDILKKQYPEQLQDIDLTATQMGHMMVNSARRELQNDTQAAYDAVQDFLLKIMPTKVKPTGFDFKAPTKKGNPGASTWKQAFRNMLNNIRTTAMSSSMRKFRKVDPSDKEALSELKWKKQQSELGKYDWKEDEEKELQELTALIKADGTDPDTILPEKPKRRGRRDRTIDEAFGKRGEDGGDPSGGEAYITDEKGLGGGGGVSKKPLDDKAALKEFYDVVDEHVGELKSHLKTPGTLELFTLVFDLDVGGFGSDIEDNMGQASELKNLMTEGKVEGKPVPGYPTPESKALYEKNAKRWSGFVGDVRKKLMVEIESFVEKYMSPGDYEVLHDTYFSDTSYTSVDKLEKKKEEEKNQYQGGIDERKLSRMKYRLQNGLLTPEEETEFAALSNKDAKELTPEEKKRIEFFKKERMSQADKKSMDNLMKKLKAQGVDVDAVPATNAPEGQAKPRVKNSSMIERIASYYTGV